MILRRKSKLGLLLQRFEIRREGNLGGDFGGDLEGDRDERRLVGLLWKS